MLHAGKMSKLAFGWIMKQRLLFICIVAAIAAVVYFLVVSRPHAIVLTGIVTTDSARLDIRPYVPLVICKT